MTLQDIIELTKAGYTKADIAQLTQAADPGKKAQANPPEKAPVSPAPAPAGDPAMTAMQAQIDALKQMMQINNMLTVNQNAPKERTIDDIFAEIINPPMPENKDK